MALSFLKLPGKGSEPFPAGPEDPIRSELFSVERLEQHGESLAAAQRTTPHPPQAASLAARLRDNERVLLAAYRSIPAGRPPPG